MPADRDAIADKVKSFLADSAMDIEADEMKGTDELTSLGIDSVDVLEMLFKIEEDYDLKIEDEVVAGFKTIDDIVNHINENLPSDTAEAAG